MLFISNDPNDQGNDLNVPFSYLTFFKSILLRRVKIGKNHFHAGISHILPRPPRLPILQYQLVLVQVDSKCTCCYPHDL